MSAPKMQLLGWSPTPGDDHEDVSLSSQEATVWSSAQSTPLLDRHRSADSPASSLATTLSRSVSIDSGSNITSYRRAQRNLERDPNWAPRPRNPFIIFRCDYARIHSQSKSGEDSSGHGGIGNEDENKPTLSKRAGDAWKNLSDAERNKYKALAKIEAAAHKKRHPSYRYRPVKRSPPSDREKLLLPDPNPERAKTEIPGDLATDSGRGRWPYTWNLSEPTSAINESPVAFPNVDNKQVQAARRRSSSVPLSGIDFAQFIQPWIMAPAREEHPALTPIEVPQNVDPRGAISGSSMPVQTMPQQQLPDEYFWPETFGIPQESQTSNYTDPSLVQLPPSSSAQPFGNPQMNQPVSVAHWSAAGPTWEQAPTQSSLWSPTPIMQPSTYPGNFNEAAQVDPNMLSASTLGFDEGVTAGGYYFLPASQTTGPGYTQIQGASNDELVLKQMQMLNEPFRMMPADLELGGQGMVTDGRWMTGACESMPMGLDSHAPAGAGSRTSVVYGSHGEYPMSSVLPPLDFDSIYLGPQILTTLSHLSSPFLATFLAVHLSAPLLSNVGGSSLASQTLLLGREYYQTSFGEKYLLAVPIAVHATAGIAKRLLALYNHRPPARPATHLLSTTAYAALFLFLPVHVLTHRVYPTNPAPPTLAVGPAELDF